MKENLPEFEAEILYTDCLAAARAMSFILALNSITIPPEASDAEVDERVAESYQEMTEVLVGLLQKHGIKVTKGAVQ